MTPILDSIRSTAQHRACLSTEIHQATARLDLMIEAARSQGHSWSAIAAAAGEAEPTLRIRYQRRRG